MIYDVISSEYFIKNVGHIFTEVGAFDQRDNVLKFTKTRFSTAVEKNKEQLKLYRNLYYPIWEKTNFFDFIGRINSLNAKLNNADKIDLLTSNNRNPTPQEIASPESFKRYFNENWRKRDSIMAKNIIHTFEQIKNNEKRKKCLVIMNYRHAFSQTLVAGPELNVGHYLLNHFKDKFANIYINGVAPTTTVLAEDKSKAPIFQNMTETLIQNGKWDAAFRSTGVQNAGFAFSGSPFGQDKFDIWPYSNHQYTYADIFTGFVYYLPIEKHLQSFGIPHITDDGYLDELYNKLAVFNKCLDRPAPPKEGLAKCSVVVTVKYDDLEKMDLLIGQWLK